MLNRPTKNAEKPAEKLFPSAVECEMAILGAIMIEKDAIERAIEFITVDSFYKEAHKIIFEAILSLKRKGTPIDIMTVVNELVVMGKLESVGGAYEVTKLTNNVVSSANLEAHCAIVQQKYIRRAMIRITDEIRAESFDNTVDEFDLLEHSQDKIFEITKSIGVTPIEDIASSLYDVIQTTTKARENPGVMTGVPSGFPSIDRVTNGWQKTDLIILAARPSVGKTAFALNIAKNAAMYVPHPTPVLIFSLEMSRHQLTQRLLSATSGVQLEKIKTGRLTDDEMKRLIDCSSNVLGQTKIFIHDRAATTLFEIFIIVKRWVTKNPDGLVIIDYLQLVDSGLGPRTPREQQISHTSRSLKKLAKETNCPIIALSQLSRAIDERSDNEPKLSDLRESGAIEQDADLVAFIYKATKQDIQKEPSLKDKGMIKIAKHRNGTLWDGVFNFYGDIQLWTEITQDAFSPLKPISQF